MHVNIDVAQSRRETSASLSAKGEHRLENPRFSWRLPGSTNTVRSFRLITTKRDSGWWTLETKHVKHLVVSRNMHLQTVKFRNCFNTSAPHRNCIQHSESSQKGIASVRNIRCLSWCPESGVNQAKQKDSSPMT